MKPTSRKERSRNTNAPGWLPVAGLVAGFMTLGFLMYLVGSGSRIDCEKAAITAFLFAFSTAMSFAFLGGWAAASGNIPITDLFGQAVARPLKFSFRGGVALLPVVFLITYPALRCGNEQRGGQEVVGPQTPGATGAATEEPKLADFELRGVVVDDLLQRPVPNVLVELRSLGTAETTTNGAGEFRAVLRATGTAAVGQVYLSRDGFEPLQKTIDLGPGINTVRLELQSSGNWNLRYLAARTWRATVPDEDFVATLSEMRFQGFHELVGSIGITWKAEVMLPPGALVEPGDVLCRSDFRVRMTESPLGGVGLRVLPGYRLEDGMLEYCILADQQEWHLSLVRDDFFVVHRSQEDYAQRAEPILQFRAAGFPTT